MAIRHCLTLDLKDDPDLIAAYRRHHRAVWPEVLESLHAAGILGMEIYLHGTRLVMVMEVTDDFSFAGKARADRANPHVEAWERLMWTFQQALPGSRPGEKWVPMERIFALDSTP